MAISDIEQCNVQMLAAIARSDSSIVTTRLGYLLKRLYRDCHVAGPSRNDSRAVLINPENVPLAPTASGRFGFPIWCIFHQIHVRDTLLRV